MNSNHDSPASQDGLHFGPGCGCGLVAILFIIWVSGELVLELLLMVAFRTESLGPWQSLLKFAYTLSLSVLAYYLLRYRNPLKVVGLSFDPWTIPYWAFGMFVGAFGVAIALGIIALFGDLSLKFGSLSHPEVATLGPFGWFAAIFMFVVYAGDEEILARGLLYPLLKRSTGFIWATLLSSLVFCLLHTLNLNFSILPAIDIFLAGILLCLLRELTGNLFLAWGVHFGWNMSIVALGIPVSGLYAKLEPQIFHVAIDGPTILTGGRFGIEGGLAGITANLVLIAIAGYWVIEKHFGKWEREMDTLGAQS